MAPASKTQQRLSYLGGVLVLLAAYFVTARFGLLLDAVSGFATQVWPPTGIALAAMLVFGRRYWPGIAVGAFLVNYAAGATPLVALGIAAGNTAEALIASHLLSYVKFRNTIDRLRDAIAYIVLAAGLSAMVSATVGAISLYLGGVIDASAFLRTWSAWWTGDALGALVVGTFLLTWIATPRQAPRPERTVEGTALALTLFVCDMAVFGGIGGEKGAGTPLIYVLFLPLIWASLRFGQLGAATATFAMSAMAIWGTAAGHGPFVRETLSESLFYLQMFMAIVTVMSMIMAAIVSELKGAEEDVRRLSKNLEKRVADRTVQLRRANKELGRSEDALEKRTTILQSVLHTIEEGVVATDKEGRALVINPAAMRILGMARSEITTPLEKLAERFPFFFRDGKTPIPFSELPIVKALRGEETVELAMMVRTPRSEEGIPVKVTARPVKDEKDRLIGAIVVLHREAA